MSARSLHGPDGPLKALGVKDMSLIALKHMWWPVALISHLVEADSADRRPLPVRWVVEDREPRTVSPLLTRHRGRCGRCCRCSRRHGCRLRCLLCASSRQVSVEDR